MRDNPSSTSTLEDDHEPHRTSATNLDLCGLPPVYVLPTHLSMSELHEIEERLNQQGAPLTYDAREARLFLGSITTAKRARFELQWRKLSTEDLNPQSVVPDASSLIPNYDDSSIRKRRKLSGGTDSLHVDLALEVASQSSTASEIEDENLVVAKPVSQLSITQDSAVGTALFLEKVDPTKEVLRFTDGTPKDTVKVVRLAWLTDSLRAGKLCHLEPYVLYEGMPRYLSNDIVPQKLPRTIKARAYSPNTPQLNAGMVQEASERAKNERVPGNQRYIRRDRAKDAMQLELKGRTFLSSTQSLSQNASRFLKRPPHLIHQTTSEHDENAKIYLPEMPRWVKEHKTYACERATPLRSLNDVFIEQLKRIRLARTLTGDDIGVRAYSSSIASIAAYPHTLSSTKEILALPGCDQKIAHLFDEWQTSSGNIQAVADFEADPVMKTLRLFYNIWGVGAITAREFYYDKGWRDFDDIIEEGWHLLSRVQQIGLKYYDEFELKIPRPEVEQIASIVVDHARQLVGNGIECIIVGGYRRGKLESGDVDIILSHQDEDATLNLITPVVDSLEKEGWITHTLTLNTTNSKRGQQTLPIKSSGTRGNGFDTLDKALVVWQDPSWSTEEADIAANSKAKNPNVHRRVDIIISPWRTIGCAVQGWTSGTTFNRDLRRYARKIKGWKFDSSGVRQRGNGAWVDLEQWSNERTRATSWEEAEKRVFEGLGLEYTEPWERNTG
ncbi:hypothetical protein MMC06_005956 [Schaereria dolodes]|nr:hypothetical protein [Schaereria dolodes]